MAITLGRSALASGINLIVSQGADNIYQFRWFEAISDVGGLTPVDLSGYTARAQFRTKVGADVWIELTSPDEILLDSEGHITIHLDDTATESDLWNLYKTGFWDIELASPTGIVTRFAEGSVTVSPDVTRTVAP